MGIFDSIKKATGLGLNAEEHYSRAWEKSVLLGPAKYGEAVALFQTAATKADEAGDALLAQRARANAHLYGFVATGKGEHLLKLRQHLEGLTEIEAVGSRSETLSAEELRNEIDARVAEALAENVRERDHAGRAEAHARAAAAFKPIFSNALLTYRYHSPDQHRETAQSRYYLHEGLSAWHRANITALHDPTAASGELARAMSAFTNAGDQEWSVRTQGWSSKLKMSRTCWCCHRQFLGEDLHYEVASADVTPYTAAVVASLGQDQGCLDLGSGTVVICSACASVVRRMADVIAERRTDELRTEVNAKLDKIIDAVNETQQAVRNLSSRIASLESVAHRH